METIKVIRKSDGEECIINKVDFDPELHELVGKKPAAKKADAADGTKDDSKKDDQTKGDDQTKDAAKK